MLTEAFAFNFNMNMKNGEGCVYAGGKIICRESTKKQKKTSRDCMVNLWGEVVCFERNHLPYTSIEEDDEEEDDDIEEQEPEPFFRIR